MVIGIVGREMFSVVEEPEIGGGEEPSGISVGIGFIAGAGVTGLGFGTSFLIISFWPIERLLPEMLFSFLSSSIVVPYRLLSEYSVSPFLTV